jgi:hypothetical protein
VHPGHQLTGPKYEEEEVSTKLHGVTFQKVSQHSYTVTLRLVYICPPFFANVFKRIFFQRVLLTKLLGAFAKLRTATISFVMTVCLSVSPPACMEQCGCHRKDFHKI